MRLGQILKKNHYMSKDKASSDGDKSSEEIATDPDPVRVGEREPDADAAEPAGDNTDTDAIQLGYDGAAAERQSRDAAGSAPPDKDPEESEAATAADATGDAAQANESTPGSADDAAATATAEASADAAETAADGDGSQPPPVRERPRRSWFAFFDFLLILALAGAGGWYWWQQQQVVRDYEATIAELDARLDAKAEVSRLDSSLAPLRSGLAELRQNLEQLESGQQDLRASSEKLFELYGRDKNDWQFAEVEYLLRIAQHRLILQQDFEGAAATLQAASDKIAEIGDPGMLPVRVTISEEIADLKTRRRPDLVGMTLVLAQLARQVPTLQPGFDLRSNLPETPAAETPPKPSEDVLGKVIAWVDSLVEIRHEATRPSEIEASIVDVGATLQDNLKLARWAVLDRDAWQYNQLIAQSLRLFREFYDLDHAANADFHDQLKQLEQTQLRPQLPDITGSLLQLRQILSQRKNAPAEAAPGEEATDA